jgi:magnesium transporter
MIRIMKNSENGLTEISKYEKNCWVNVINPDAEELSGLSADLDISMDFLNDSLDVDERSRIETEDNGILMIFRLPRYDSARKDIPYRTLPAGIFIRKNMLITVCSVDIVEILDLYNRKIRNIILQNRKRFILIILQRAALYYMKYLKEINRHTSAIEKMLQKSTKNEELIKLLNNEKSLVFFTTSLKSNELMMEKMMKLKDLKFDEDDRELIEDIIIDNRQAIEMSNIYSNILSSLMDAFASVISNNLSMVIKILTSVTIILMIPTLVASVYGMNVELPFQHSPHAFTITMIISLLASFGSVLIFLKNRWF